jgi:transcriptional regulator with XRE-family HTH domain
MRYPIGTHIRSYREQKDETLKVVANRAGVSESLLSQIERNKISPAIETLFKITDALGVEPEIFFSEISKEREINIVKKNDRKTFEEKGIVFHKLSRTINSNSRNEIEAYMIEVAPGHEKESSVSTHTGQECGIIISGKAQFLFGEKEYVLETGDSISFSATVPHQIKNIGKTVMKAYWVASPPKKSFNT